MRALLTPCRGWFVLLMALTFAARVIVPAGFMPAVVQGGAVLQLCPGTLPAPAAMPGMHHEAPAQDEHGKAESPCAFAGLGLPALGSADPVLLVAAVLFAFLLSARAVVRVPPAPPGRLRPPLRAPPAIA